MSKIGSGLTVRKTIFLNKNLFNETSKIAEDLGLSYTEYIRKLLVDEIERITTPPNNPELPALPPIHESLAYMSTKKRRELIKIMNRIRELL